MKRIPHWLLAITLIPCVAIAQDDFQLSQEETTLRLKPENLQWTPHSVTVLEADEVAESAFWDLEDLEGSAPGVIIDRLAGTPRGAAISIRGISSAETSPGFFPAVAVNVDGVYVGTHASQNQVLFDFDRVEIARGPQAGFGGAPAQAGSINIERRQPSQELMTLAELTVGDFDRLRLNTVVNLPITDRLTSRISMTLQDGGEYLDNVSPDPAAIGRRENSEEQVSARASIRYEVAADTFVQYTYDGTRDQSDVPARMNISTASTIVCNPADIRPACSQNGQRPESGGFLGTTQNFSNARNYDVDQHAIYFDFRVADHQVKSVTAWRKSRELSDQDLDGTFLDIYSSTARREYDQFTQEFTILGELGDKLRYSGGLFYLNNEYLVDSMDFYALPALDNAGRILDVAPDAVRSIKATQDATVVSYSLHAEYVADDQWTLDAGIQWNDAQRNYRGTVTRIASATPSAPPSERLGEVRSRELTGSAGAAYQVDDEAMVFIRYSRAFRPVGFDDAAPSADSAGPFGEETVDSVEIGLKSEWFNDRLRLNYATYTTRHRDKLERFAARVASGRIESVYRNVSRMEVRGHELEIEAVPLRDLRLRATLNHQNADYLEYDVPDLAGGPDPIDRSNLVPLFAPTDMFQFSGLYTRPFQEGTLNFYASYRFTKEYWTNHSASAGRIDNFTMLDLSVDYLWRDFTFRLFSRNSNGKRFLTNVSSPQDAWIASLAPEFTSTVGIATTAEINDPEFTGIQIIYTPDFSR